MPHAAPGRAEVPLPSLGGVVYTSGMLISELIPAQEKDSRHLMVVLHGLGDSMDGYRFLPEVLELPWMNYLLVNAPDDYYGGYSWYDFPGEAGPGIRRSAQLLFDLLDRQRAAGFPSEQTTLFGFSQGCLMTIEVGLRYPHRLAGLVGVSGYVHQPERLLREKSSVAGQQRLLMTHGKYDPLIPLARAHEHAELLRQAGVPVTWQEFAKDHTIAGEAEIDVIREFVLEGRRKST